MAGEVAPTPPGTPRRTSGILSGLLRPFLYIADDVVQKYQNEPPPPPQLAFLPPLFAPKRADDSSAESGASTESNASGGQVQLKRRTVEVCRGESFVKLGLAFEKLSGASPRPSPHPPATP